MNLVTVRYFITIVREKEVLLYPQMMQSTAMTVQAFHIALPGCLTTTAPAHSLLFMELWGLMKWKYFSTIQNEFLAVKQTQSHNAIITTLYTDHWPGPSYMKKSVKDAMVRAATEIIHVVPVQSTQKMKLALMNYLWQKGTMLILLYVLGGVQQHAKAPPHPEYTSSRVHTLMHFISPYLFSATWRMI